MENLTRSLLGEARYGRLFTGYAAPTILLCALCLLLVFERLEIKSSLGKRIVALVAPLSFSVYLIHTHPMIWDTLLKGAFASYRYFFWPFILAAVPVTAAAVYAACSLIDLVRKKLFDLIGIRQFSERAAGALERVWVRLLP